MNLAGNTCVDTLRIHTQVCFFLYVVACSFLKARDPRYSLILARKSVHTLDMLIERWVWQPAFLADPGIAETRSCKNVRVMGMWRTLYDSLGRGSLSDRFVLCLPFFFQGEKKSCQKV